MINSQILMLGTILMVVFATLSERKVMGVCQRRVGPNSTGYMGLQQPLCDGVKLQIRESIVPSDSNTLQFVQSPFFFFGVSLLNWFIIPLDYGVSLSEVKGVSVLISITLSEISIQGILYAGYASNSKYSLLGCLRAVGQMISYSVAMSLCIIAVIMTVGSPDYLLILESQMSTPLIFALLPVSIIQIISCVAELGRPPFDQLEAESEQVAGHMTEFSGVMFAFFFLAEYSSMLFLGVFLTVLLFGTVNPLPFQFLLFWLRASLPRLRIDSVLSMGWSHFQPFLTAYIIFLPSFLLTFDMLG